MNKKQDDFFIYVAPISGGKLISQLAFLCEIFEARKNINGGKLNGRKTYMPDLCFGSSGGNISLYIASAGGWTTDGIISSSKNLDPNSFSKKWIPKELSIIPNIAISIFKGSLYDKGYGAKPLFNRFFCEKSIAEVEIWTGSFNEDEKSSQFFCNKYQSDSFINQCFSNGEQYLFDSLKLQYMNEDIDLISDVTIASASIPLIVPNQKINNVRYGDGGVSYPSPLSVFSSEVCRIISNKITNTRKIKLILNDGNVDEYVHHQWENEKTFINLKDGVSSEVINSNIKNNNNEKNLRLIYFMPYQANRIITKKMNNLEDELDVINQILHISMIRDRNTAIDILKNLCDCNVSHMFYSDINNNKLTLLMKKLEEYKHYVIIFSPHGQPSVSLTNFTCDEILHKIELIREKYNIDIWHSNQKK